MGQLGVDAPRARPRRPPAAPRRPRGRARRRRRGRRAPTAAPAAASQAAVFAAEPPPRKLISAGVSLACASGPDSRTTTSTMRSPRTTIRLTPRARDAISAASRALRTTSRTFASRLAPPVSSREVVEQERASRPCRARRPPRPRSAPRQHAVVQRRVELLVGAAAGSPPRQRGRRCPSSSRARTTAATSAARVHPPRHGEAGVGEVEAREAVGAVAEHRRRSASRAAPASRRRRGSTSRRRRPPRSPSRASVSRSADSSQLSRASRCTPPSPPVANTRMPARAARCAVAGDRGAAVPAAGGDRRARSRTPHFTTSSRSAISLSASSSSPTRASPRTTRDRGRHGARRPAPLPRPARATSRLRGRGSPWRDDRALERDDRPAPATSASATSGAIRMLRRRVLDPDREALGSRAASRISWLFSRPRVWSTSLIAVSRTWISMPSRRCSTSTTLPPRSATTRSSPASAPGRSGTTVESTIRRPAAVSPSRIASESSDTSTLPPDSTAHTDPSSGGSTRPCISAATATAPAPSTTSFERSSSSTIACATSSSETVTTSCT